MSKDKVKIIPDDLILCINDFKKSLNGQTISIHGKDYATVALRLAVLRRNLGAKAKIETEIVSIDKDTVVCKATVCRRRPNEIVGNQIREESENGRQWSYGLQVCSDAGVGESPTT